MEYEPPHYWLDVILLGGISAAVVAIIILFGMLWLV
jgi:hypothetical protein